MKVAAFDFDGTLHRNGEVSPADTAAIDAWREAGHLAISATGRSRSSLAYGLSGTDRSFDYNVLSNGCAGTDNAGNLLFGHFLNPSLAEEVVRHFLSHDGVAVYGTTAGEHDLTFANNTGTTTELTRGFLPAPVSEVRTTDIAVVALWVPENPQLHQRVVDTLTTHFPQAHFTTNHEFVDVIATGRDKGTGITDVLAHAGVSDYELYTFGDSWNDLPMHAIADHSFSFPYSPTDVKEATDQVIDHVAPVLLSAL